MPLLKRKAFEKSSGLEFLRDDEEVFHCEITGEIFRDYEEYCERIILVNSMVWSCEMTGKPNLTYAEALQSEKNARLSLRDFPMELRIPILYLASKTKRCTFAEMLDDVFNFVRDRYFVGETVEACLESDSWSEGHVLSVTAPKQAPEVFVNTPGSPSKLSSMYSYEVEQFDSEEEGGCQGQIGIVSHDRVRRSRGTFTRDKNKLFLKQFVEQGPGGVIRIKEDAILKYNINKVNFDQIFTGVSPIFPSSKKFDMVLVNNITNQGKLQNGQKKPAVNKKSHQQSIDKFVSKVDKFNGTKLKATDAKFQKLDQKSLRIRKNKLPDEKTMKKQMKMMQEERKRKRMEDKLLKKERTRKLAAYVKEWSKQKDDLDLEDHKPLPKAIPIEIPGIPNKYFGNFMAILEFLDVFAKAISLKDTFHSGVDLEMLRRALTVKEVAGPLSEICQMLLTAIFRLQEDEADEYNEEKNLQTADDIRDNPEDVDMNVEYGVQLATAASKWSQTYLATPLSKLPMDSQTFSEILRLHLLSSGCSGGEHCVKWRYQQRGGYNSQSDPGLMLRIKKPYIIRALAKKHLTELPLSYKMNIFDCLINQILSYATMRDIVEERVEKTKNIKLEIKNLQGAERKLEVELMLACHKLRRDAYTKKEEEKLIGEQAAAVDQETAANVELLIKENDSKKAENEKKFKSMQLEYFALQSYLGSDRAHRRYWLFESIPGLFIEHDLRLGGICNDKVIVPNPSLATAPPEDTLKFVKKQFESEQGGNSDKENDSENSISKINHSMDGNKSPKKVVPDQNALFQDLLMCTANAQTCPVHSPDLIKTRWSVMNTSEHVDSLVVALNKRGFREAELRQTLEAEKAEIVNYIAKCPISSLNPAEYPPVSTKMEEWKQTRLNRKYADANLRFPPGTETDTVLEMTVRDTVLDLEEKLFLGCLGELKVKDRQAWRDTILKRGYDKQCGSLLWGPTKSLTDDLQIINGKVNSAINISSYRDPGSRLTSVDYSDNEEDTDSKPESDNDADDSASAVREKAVKSMASALLQLGQAVLHKNLKRPLGYNEKEHIRDPNVMFKYSALRRWEISLMECTNYAQIILHLVALENSIVWSKSVLNANCRLCRKKTDAENMLLCDSCNKGHHMYCLKPKLTEVPEGDWFCDQCKPKEKTPRNRVERKVFNDDDSGAEMDDTNTSWNSNNVTNVCGSCRSGGALIQCNVCQEGWHLECLPKLPPKKSSFTCTACSKSNKQNRDWKRRVRRCAADAMNNVHHYAKMLKQTSRQDSDSESADETPVKISKAKKKRISKEASPALETNNSSAKRARRSLPVTNGFANPTMDSTVRRCAADAINNAHHYAKMVKRTYRRSDSESSDEPLSTLKPKRKSRVSKEMSPLTNGSSNSKRSSRANDDNPKRNSASVNGLLNTFARKSRNSEAFHRSRIEELLESVMRHKDSWPFNAPVTLDEVPDYFRIIKEPMDFGTIKSKVTSGRYLVDTQFMADADLVFNNCFTYNQDDDAVAKAGIRLKKFFEKRCKELNLSCFPSDESAQ